MCDYQSERERPGDVGARTTRASDWTFRVHFRPRARYASSRRALTREHAVTRAHGNGVDRYCVPGIPADGSGHYFDSVEHQDSAAAEGFAHFYAAATWNDTTDSDCEFVYYKTVDYDLRNGVADPNGNYDCAASGHFMEDYCNGDGPFTGLGNEADWLLFLWDVMKSYSSSADNIYDIWDQAQPGQGDWDRYECYGLLRDAAIDLGFSSFLWDVAAAVNGVDH